MFEIAYCIVLLSTAVGKELGFQLKFVEWSPDGSMSIFVSLDTEVFTY